MRPLNRPMFRYGGPIKEGIMDGIREPKKNGGPTGTGLVGDQRYPKTDGREHHYFFLPAIGSGLMAAVRALPTVYRGIRMAGTPRTPGTAGFFRNLFPTARFRTVPGKQKSPSPEFIKGDPTAFPGGPGPAKTLGLGEALKNPLLLGKAIRENPFTALTAASAVPQATFLAGKGAVGAAKSLPDIAKGYIEAVLPGKQFREKDGSPKTDPSGVSNINKAKAAIGMPENLTYREPPVKKPGAGVELSDKELRQQKIDRYRDIMDIKGMNKKAAYNSLIEASRLINESGDFKGDLKSGKLINQIIQGASKAFDKPAQTKDAIDTLILKGEIEKDIKASDPASKIANELNLKRIQKLNKELEGTSFAEAKVAASKTMSGQSGIDAAASISSDNFKGNLLTKTQLTDVMEKAKGAGEISEQDIIIAATTEVIKDKNLPDGDYTVGDVLVTITQGQVTDLKR